MTSLGFPVTEPGGRITEYTYDAVGIRKTEKTTYHGIKKLKVYIPTTTGVYYYGIKLKQLGNKFEAATDYNEGDKNYKNKIIAIVGGADIDKY